MNYCNNNNIRINIPVTINEEEIYKYNPKSDFYKDICFSYENDKKVDVTIYDRKKEYNNYNMSLCPKNCRYAKYDNVSKKVECQCDSKYNNSLLLLEDIINKDKLVNIFIDIKTISNIEIFKCFQKVFTSESLKSNIGSYILIIIIFLFIIGSILFYTKGYIYILNVIDNIIAALKNKYKKNKKDDKKIQHTVKRITIKKTKKKRVIICQKKERHQE